jgi:hypothetical protein
MDRCPNCFEVPKICRCTWAQINRAFERQRKDAEARRKELERRDRPNAH